MNFKSEIERIQHPQIGLIPKNQWRDWELFNQEFTPEHFTLMQTPLDRINDHRQLLRTINNKKTAWICIVLGHPNATTEQILALNELLEIPPGEVLILAASLGKLDVVRAMIEDPARDIRNKLLLIYTREYQAFVEASINGHISVLNYFLSLDNLLSTELIKNHKYEAYFWAARRGHLEIIKLLERTAPDLRLEMLQENNYQPYYFAAKNNHLPLLIHFETTYPKQVQDMIRADNFCCYRLACSYGHLKIVEHIEKVAPNLCYEMVSAQDFEAYGFAAEHGHLHIMTHLEKKWPKLIEKMIQGKNYYAYHWAAHNAPMEVINHMEQVAPTLVSQMISADKYTAYRRAASTGRYNLLKHFEKKLPHAVNEMVSADDFAAFRWAAQKNNFVVTRHLLEFPPCFAYAEQNYAEYGKNFVSPFIQSSLIRLRRERQQFAESEPNKQFNIHNKDDIDRYFYIIRNLIRQNNPEQDDDLRFLLNIPALKAKACVSATTNQPNELLKLAASTNNNRAKAFLLALPLTSQLEQHTNKEQSTFDNKTSWFSSAALYIANRPNWQKVLAGIIITIPLVITGIFAPLVVSLTLGLSTLAVALGFAFIVYKYYHLHKTQTAAIHENPQSTIQAALNKLNLIHKNHVNDNVKKLRSETIGSGIIHTPSIFAPRTSNTEAELIPNSSPSIVSR
ncbi:MAG: hypothetical protein WC627_03870 [Legionella sp.]|jgi:hypothetical protein